MALTAPRRPAFVVASLALAVLAWSQGTGAQEAQRFLEAYKAGVEAVAAEDWPRAERLMRTAVAGRAEAADRLLRHLHLRPYVPHFYLGLALAEQGRCEEALEAFAESERQGVVTGLGDEMAVLRDREGSCREVLAAADQARRERQAVTDLVAEAERAADGVAELAGDPALAPGWERGTPSLADRLEEASTTIAQARERMETGDTEPSDLAAATDLARGALGQLAAIRRESELRREAAEAERETTMARVDSLVESARDLLTETEELPSEATGLAGVRSSLAEAVGRAPVAATDLPLPDLQALAASLERRTTALRAAAAPPPDALLAVADAWLRGNPRTVFDILGSEEVPFQEPRARAHALLLRSAAAFALHRSEATPDLALLESARQDAAACRGLDPDLDPIPSAFPPRFRAFWAAVEPEPPSAPEEP